MEAGWGNLQDIVSIPRQTVLLAGLVIEGRA